MKGKHFKEEGKYVLILNEDEFMFLYHNIGNGSNSEHKKLCMRYYIPENTDHIVWNVIYRLDSPIADGWIFEGE